VVDAARIVARTAERSIVAGTVWHGPVPPGIFFGSSPNSGEGRPDLEEEVGVIAKAIGHALDDLDLVVDFLDQVGAEGILAVGQDAWKVRLQVAGEAA
jgi:hypothetical protein